MNPLPDNRSHHDEQVRESTITPMRRNAALSLRRGLQLLSLVADSTRHNRPTTLTEIAQSMGISRSSALRLSAPLVEQGLVRRTKTGLELGVGALDLGQSYLDGIDLRTVAAPFLRAAAEKTGQTCHLVIPQDRDVIYVDKVELEATPRMGSRIGGKMPMHRTAVGRAILANSAPELFAEVDEGIGWGSDGAGADKARAAFRAEIDRTRMRGYGIDDCENEEAVRCVGAPIFDHRNIVIGALSISSLRHRMPPRLMRQRGVYVMYLGLQISVALGSNAAGLRLARLDRARAAAGRNAAGQS